MDVFSIDRETYTNGTNINGIKSVLWIERYNKESEFTIVGDPTVPFRNALKIGTLISHTNSETIMIVESHEINEALDGSPVLTVTGRDIAEVAMENRPIIFNGDLWDSFVDDYTTNPVEFNLDEHSTWWHAKRLLQYFLERSIYNPQLSLPNLLIRTDISVSESPLKTRVIPRLNLLSSVIHELLTSIDAGLKVERINSDHTDHIEFVIHEGEDKSDVVRFYWNSGDLESAHYLWSHKNFKNSAYVAIDGYTLQILDPTANGLGLRIIPVDDNIGWDKPNEDELTGLTLLYVKDILSAKGIDQINRHKSPCIIDAVISKGVHYRYNVDYKMGDLVYVVGNYGCEEVMRVVEYALTHDDTGSYGVPTLLPVTPITDI